MLSLGALNNTLVLSPPSVQAGITDISGSFPGTLNLQPAPPTNTTAADVPITELEGMFPDMGSPNLFQLPPVYQPTNATPAPISTVPSTFTQPETSAPAATPNYTPILFAGLGVIVVALIVTMPKGRRR